jgi:aryl-alcohol dehydrogenase-like predicted oxidoreductase
VEKIKTLAAEKSCTPAQLAIAWVISQGNDIITIPGSKSLKHLEENIASENIQLTRDDLESINQIMPVGIVSGARYPEKFLHALNR